MPAPVMEHDLQRSPDMRAGGTQATTSTTYLSRLATAAPESRRSGGRYSPGYRYQGRRSRSPTSSQRTPYTSRAASPPSRQYWTALPEALEDTVSERPEKRPRLDRWQPPFTAEASGYGSRTAVSREICVLLSDRADSLDYRAESMITLHIFFENTLPSHLRCPNLATAMMGVLVQDATGAKRSSILL